MDAKEFLALTAGMGNRPFADYFQRADGALGNGWTGSSWSIASGHVVNTLAVISQLFANPGAEGTYVGGVAPSWVKGGGTDLTPSEEGTIVHGGSKAQKVVGGTTANVLVQPNTVTVTIGDWIKFKGWLRNDGPGDVGTNRQNNRLPNMVKWNSPEAGVYKPIMMLDKAVSTGTETIRAIQHTTTMATWWADDWTLEKFIYSSLICSRRHPSQNVKIGAAITEDLGERAGVVSHLDSDTNPQNYITAYMLNGVITLSQVLSRVETVLMSTSCPAEAGGLLELRNIGTTFRVLYNGRQRGSSVTIDNVALNNNHFIGFYSTGAATFKNCSVRRNSADPDYLPTTRWTTATYQPDRGTISMRFDDSTDDDYDFTYPALESRGLVGGFAVIEYYIDASGRLTLDQILEMQASGNEMMCHSRTHHADPASFAMFRDEAVASGHEMMRLGLDIASFVQPGVWVVPGAYLLDETSLGSAPDLLLKKNYFIYEAYGNFFDHGLPSAGLYNMPRSSSSRYACNTISIDPWTLVAWNNFLDTITPNLASAVLFHSANFDLPGHTSKAVFLSMMDSLETRIAAGTMQCLTPTQEAYATPI